MLANYLKVALRTLSRYRVYASVNVVGLAVGLAVCSLIYLFVQDELGYDRYHEKADRTYRITGEEHAALVEPLVPVAVDEVPEIEVATRVYPMLWSKPLLRFEERAFYESRVFLVDSTFFDVFGYELTAGNSDEALSRPFTVVLTQSTARRYFGSRDPVGHSISYDNKNEFEVTGVVQDPNPQSHLQFDVLLSFASMYPLEEEWGVPLTWGNYSFHAYARLVPGVAPSAIAEKLDGVFLRHTNDEEDPELVLQPVSDIHLHPVANDEFSARGSITYVYVFGSMAIMVLVIACANFTNLATAQSTTRAKEVGLRKALGAHRGELVRQFMGESVLMSLIALGLAAILISASLPMFNAVAGKNIEMVEAFGLAEVGFMIGIAVLAGILAGVYPAVYLSRFESASVVKGQSPVRTGRGLLRKSMVVGQFTIGILLLAGTFIAVDQLDYLKSRDTGITEDQVIVVPMTDRSLRARIETLESEMRDNPNVRSVSTSHRVPGEVTNGFTVAREGQDPIVTREFGIDDDFLGTYEIELLAGRSFTDGPVDAEGGTVLINRAALEALGWANPEEAIGKTVAFGDQSEVIVGVFENFNFRSLHHPVQPLVLHYYGFRMYLSLRVAPVDLNETISHVETTWARLSPEFPLSYYFLDQRLDDQYKAEQRIGQLFRIFAGLALLIGCMGLFGLSAFTTQKRAKEVGIRKALGASVSQIVGMFSSEYTGLLLIAWVIAAPIAYLGGRVWMSGFAYQADLGLWPYLLPGLATMLLAWLTISYQSVKAATANPVETLRYE